METIAYYQRNNDSGHVVRHVGFDENNDFQFAFLFEDKPFSVRKFDVEQNWRIAKDFDITKVERQTCGRRMNDFGPQLQQENIDYWQDRGTNQKHCSYCGSVSFETFLSVIDGVNADLPGFSVDTTDKSYKYYLSIPGHSHLKFYTPHIPNELFDDKTKLSELNEKLGSAAKKSWSNFMKKSGRSEVGVEAEQQKPVEDKKPDVKAPAINPQDIVVLIPGAKYQIPTFKVGELGLERGEDIIVKFCKGNKQDPNAPRQTGVLTETLIALAKLNLEELNVPPLNSRETSMVITKLDEALMWTEKRNKDRQKRGVQGSYQK